MPMLPADRHPLLILADDLTGAGDSAARCRATGMAATISLGVPSTIPAGGALAFSSESRALPPAVAAARVHECVGHLRHRPAVWYKKIDSTLRGALGAELDAWLDALGGRAIICPAFPEQGRTLIGGVVQLHGQPLPSGDLCARLAQQSRRRCVHVPLAALRAGLLAQCAADSAADLLVVDAVSGADLAQIAALADPMLHLCGAAGLVHALAQRHAGAATMVPGGMLPVQRPLVAIGSGSAVARRQVAWLRRHRPDVAVLQLPEPPDGLALDGAAAQQVARQFAQAVVARAHQDGSDALVLSGGATAAAVLARLGITTLAVGDEPVPGVARSHGRDAAGRAWQVALKPGNHGDDAVLAAIVAQLMSA